MSTKLPRYVLMAALAGVTVSTLSACGLLLVGGTAATTALVATDRRTAGEQVDDKTIVMKAGSENRKLLENKQGRINTSSYGGLVLLTGDVPTEADKLAAAQRIAKIEKVNRVVNELRVGPPTELSVRTNDSWLFTRVSTALINTKDVPSRTISVTTERGVVYLLGMVTEAEGERAAIAAASVPGVSRVVKLFEYVSPETLRDARDSQPAVIENEPQPAESMAPTQSQVEVMPVQ